MLSVRHLLGALAVSAAAIGGIVWFAADVQHDAVRHGAEEIRRVQLIEEDVQRVEAAARGYLVTRETRFLDELTLAREELAQAVDAVVEQSQGDDEEVESITRQQALIRQWSRLVNRDVDGARGGADVPASATLARERLVQSLRAENQLLLEDEQREANAYTDRATRVLVMLVLAASAVIGTIGLAIVLWARRRREGTRVREREERESQQEFAETMQVTRNETEAHRLLKRHLERVLPGSSVVVLNRNNSKNRLEATTPVESEGLAQRLVDSTPDSCLAVRLGRTYQRRSERELLMSCELCGETTSTCVPSLVGGEVIGSVLVRQPRDLTPHEHDRVTMSVAQAAPVLANLRNLALAEIRAATDVLTGLPNKRALEDALKRQLAQASRAVDPLAVCMLDLDHFKKVNDVHGHERGDDVLAAVGDVIADTIRDSDFAGRFGGEEFLVLLPRTDVQGAKTIAEKLRTGRACPGSTAPSPRASASPCFPTTPSTGRPSCVSPTAPSTRPRREDGTSSAGSATAYWPTGTAHTPTCRPRRTTTSPRRPSELNLTDAAGRSGSHRGGRGGRRGYQHRWS